MNLFRTMEIIGIQVGIQFGMLKLKLPKKVGLQNLEYH